MTEILNTKQLMKITNQNTLLKTKNALKAMGIKFESYKDCIVSTETAVNQALDVVQNKQDDKYNFS